MVMVRREGESVHDSDRFETEEFGDIEELIDSVSHFIREQYEAEEDRMLHGGEDDATD